MSALRKTSEIARYLGKPPEEVERMMEDDGLPYVRLPGANKPAPRFRLRDFHRWLQQWNRGCNLKDFSEFEREFEAAQVRPDRRRAGGNLGFDRSVEA